MSEATRTTTGMDRIICTATWSFIWGVCFLMNIYKYFFSQCVFTECHVPVVQGTYSTCDLTWGFIQSLLLQTFFSFQVPSGCWASSWAYQWEKEPTNCWGKTTVHKINTFHNTLGGNQCHRGKGDRVGAWVVCHAYDFRNTNLKEARSSGGTWDKGFQGVYFWGVSSGTFGRLVYWSYRLWLGFKMSEQDGTENIAHWLIICLTWARPWLLFLDQTKRKLPHKDANSLSHVTCGRERLRLVVYIYICFLRSLGPYNCVIQQPYLV